MTTRRTIKYRYLKTKMALSQTVQSILDINRKRRFVQEGSTGKAALEEELKVLNAVAENHAMALRNYESQLSGPDQPLATVVSANPPVTSVPISKV